MPDESDRPVESQVKDAQNDTQESFLKEADAGREGLVNRQRSETWSQEEQTAIAGQFGNLTILQDRTDDGLKADAPPRKERTDPALLDRSGLPDAPDGKDYRGENIARSVQADTHICKANESLKDIAADHLGSGATRDEIDAYVKEIKIVNHLQSDNLQAGKTLNLPGHSDNGNAFIYKDSNGTERTVHKDGSYDIEFKDWTKLSRQYQQDGSYTESLRSHADGDQTSFSHKPGTNAGYVEEHTGFNREDKYTLTRTADGHYRIKDALGERAADKYDDGHPDIRIEHARLRDLAEAKIQDPEARKCFEQDMVRFEERFKHLEESYVKQHMTAEQAHKRAQQEVARTFHEMSRILDAQDNPKLNLSADRRATIAEQFMSHAADPTAIDQGLHPTCQTTAVEVKTFTADPSKAARMIADITTTGEYTTPDKKTHVAPDPAKLFDPQNSSMRSPPDDDQRSYLSKIFQVTAVNVELSRTGYLDEHGQPVSPYKPGDVHYEERTADPNLNPPDTGSRLVDRNGNEVRDAHGKLATSPGLTEDQITDMSNALTGQHEKAAVIDSADYVCGSGKNVVAVKNEQELETALSDAKKQGKLPLIVKVDPSNQPFWSDSGSGVAGDSIYAGAASGDPRSGDAGQQPAPTPRLGPGPTAERTDGAHVVTITDYRPAEPGPPPKPAQIDVDNSWGKKADHAGKDALTVHDLFLAMHRSGRKTGEGEAAKVDGIIDLMNQDVQSGKASSAEQLELLRQEKLHRPPSISDEQYDQQITQTYAAALKRWQDQHQAGTFDPAEQERVQTGMYAMLQNLPASRRDAILKQLAPEVKQDYDRWQPGAPEAQPAGDGSKAQPASDGWKAILWLLGYQSGGDRDRFRVAQGP